MKQKNNAEQESQRGVPKRSLANATSSAFNVSIPQNSDLSTKIASDFSDAILLFLVLYLIEFKEDKTPGLSNTAVKNLLRTDQASYTNSIPQNSDLSICYSNR